MQKVFEIRCLTFMKSLFWMVHTLLRRPDECICSVQNKKPILVIILWFSSIFIYLFIYLVSYLFCLAWISFDIVASMCVNALLCVMDAILRRPDECVRRMLDKRIIFNNFIKTFWVSVLVSSSKLQWSLRSLFKKLARF